VVSYVYDAYGRVVSISGDFASTIGDENPFRYRSYYFDSESGYYYLQSRYYDSSMGRFINADEIDNAIEESDDDLSNNLFAYCTNDPVNNIDEDGNWKLSNKAKFGIGMLALAGALALTVATGGAATPVLVGVVGSTLAGGAIGGGIGYITGGTKGLKKGIVNGAADGFMWGSIGAVGAVAGKVIKGSKAFIAVKGSVSQTKSVTKIINAATKLKYTRTALSHISSRPYMKSTLTIQQIMKTGKPVADSSLKNGYKWVVSGTYNGTKGTWELVVNASNNTIVHFLFKTGR